MYDIGTGQRFRPGDLMRTGREREDSAGTSQYAVYGDICISLRTGEVVEDMKAVAAEEPSEMGKCACMVGSATLIANSK